MPAGTNEVLTVTFAGGVYDSQTLDEPALEEVLKVMQAVTLTAQSLWRASHPLRRRLPRGYGQNLQLGIREIRASSTAPVLVRAGAQMEPQMLDDDLTTAAKFICRSFRNSRNGKQFPAELTDELCSVYGTLGTKLPEDCTMGLSAEGRELVRVDGLARQSFLERLPGVASSPVEVSGRVLAADVHRRRFQLWLDSTLYVEAPFTYEQERRITEALRSHDFMKLRVRGHGFVHRNGDIERIDRVDEVEEVGLEQGSFDPEASTIDELIASAFAGVREKDWASLPADLSARHDEYLNA